MKAKAIAVLALAPWLAGATAAMDEETRKDVRCFIVIAQLQNSEDAGLKDAGRLGSQYFLGRIDGRAPTLDLESAIAAEGASAMADQKALFTFCGGLMKKRGAEVEAIGRRLVNRGI